MKNLFIVIIGFAFLLSGSIGLALSNLSESIVITNSAVYNDGNNLPYYLFILFIVVGIINFIYVLLKNTIKI